MPEWLDALARSFTLAFTLVFMLVGLFGLIIPIFPGEIVIWMGVLFYGLVNGFSTWGIFLFILISLLAIAGSFTDNVFMARRARKEGASWWSLFFGALGGIGGTIFFPPFGGLIGAPLLLLVSEYWRQRKWRKAFRITRGLIIGWGWSVLVRFGIGLVMILLWGLWAWTNSAA